MLPPAGLALTPRPIALGELVFSLDNSYSWLDEKDVELKVRVGKQVVPSCPPSGFLHLPPHDEADHRHRAQNARILRTPRACAHTHTWSNPIEASATDRAALVGVCAAGDRP